MATTIGIDDPDLPRFIRAKLNYSAKAGKEVSSAEFFTRILDNWIEGNNEGKTK